VKIVSWFKRYLLTQDYFDDVWIALFLKEASRLDDALIACMAHE
jgi:hypothetical protein